MNRLISIAVVLLCTATYVMAQSTSVSDAERAVAEAERLEKQWWVPGNVTAIVENYDRAVSVWRANDDKPRLAKTLLAAAKMRYLNEPTDSRAGIENAREAAEIFHGLNDPAGEAEALGGIAWRENLTSWDRGLPLFEQALALARRSGSRRIEAKILYQYGLGRVQPDVEKALELLELALPLAASANDLQMRANINFAFGVAYWRLGDGQRSLTHYRQAHLLFKEFGDLSWATNSIENAGLVYSALNEPERVLESYTEALPFRRANGHLTGVADDLTNLASALIKVGRVTDALAHLDESLKIYEQTKNRFGLAWAWRIYGEASLAQKNYPRALKFFADSRQLQHELNESNGEARAIYFLALTELQRENLPAARPYLEAALALIEGERANLINQESRLAYYSARHDYYQLYLEILVRLSERDTSAEYDLKALEISERSRARNLYEALAGKPNVRSLSAGEIQRRLKPDTALLEFSLGPRASFLFVVTRDSLHIHRLPPAETIESSVRELRRSLAEPGRRNYASFVTNARRLFDVLLKPAEAQLRAKSRLQIVADATLNYLPFEVLLTREPVRDGRATFGALPYAINDWDISYAPSAGVLAEIAGRAPTESAGPALRFIGFGDPLYGVPEFAATTRVTRLLGDAFPEAGVSRLVDSNRELNSIGAGFGASARLFMREQATETNVKNSAELRSARIVHFATHGVVNEQMPETAGLLLTKPAASNEDGLLEPDEIYRLNLSAELVVLSACRTGLGRNLRGEGMMGLTRAFLRAGAKNVVASFWQVEDVSTADLMIDFYQQMTAGGNRSNALRQAKLTMLKQERFAHPYFWAPFVLVGAG